MWDLPLAKSENLIYNKVRHVCPRGVMDNTQDSGSCTGGSIPSEGVFMVKPHHMWMRGFIETETLLHAAKPACGGVFLLHKGKSTFLIE